MPTALHDVRSQGQSGKHMLAWSFSGFDPSRTYAVASGFLMWRKGDGPSPNSPKRKRLPTAAASWLFLWRHLDRDMRRGANHLNAPSRSNTPERFQHQEEFLRKHGGTSSCQLI